MALTEMQKRFHDLSAKKTEIEGSVKPVQDKYDGLIAQRQAIDAALAPVRAQLMAARQPLYEVDAERAAIARALNGQTGRA